MVGTLVICSDARGSASVVRISGIGGVFAAGYKAALLHLQEAALVGAPIDAIKRATLASWARCPGDDAGARYLLCIINDETPVPPWEREGTVNGGGV